MQDTSHVDTHARTDVLATIAVAVVVLAFAVGLPLADTFIMPRRDVVAAGTQVVLGTGGNATAAALPDSSERAVFVPAAGWEETTELRAGQGSVVLTHDGVAFDVRIEQVPGGADCATALRAAGRSLQDLDPSGTLEHSQTFVTDTEQVGLTAPYLGARIEGLVFVVCEGSVSVTATATGPVGSLEGVATTGDPVFDMARSIEII